MKRASANIDARYARSPGTAARLHLAVARAFYQRSDFDTARAEYARAATLFGKAGEADSEDAVLGRLGSIHMDATSGQPGRLEAAGAAIAKEQKALGDRAKSGRIGFALAQSEGPMPTPPTSSGPSARFAARLRSVRRPDPAFLRRSC